MGKSSINGPFSMAMLNNQRVIVYNIYNIAMYSKMAIPWVPRVSDCQFFLHPPGSFAAYCSLWLHYSIGNFASQPFDCPTELRLGRTKHLWKITGWSLNATWISVISEPGSYVYIYQNMLGYAKLKRASVNDLRMHSDGCCEKIMCSKNGMVWELW